jgi:hypothetical protein
MASREAMKEARAAHESISQYRRGVEHNEFDQAIDLYEAWLECLGDERRAHVAAVLQFLDVDLSIYVREEVNDE